MQFFFDTLTAGLQIQRSGGNDGAMVSFAEIEMFVIIPTYDDTVMAIVVLDSRLCLEGGIKVGSNVAEIERMYGELEFYIDLMTGYEECRLPKSNIRLIFKTSENKRIGIYEGIESTSKALNKNILLDRIIISR